MADSCLSEMEYGEELLSDNGDLPTFPQDSDVKIVSCDDKCVTFRLRLTTKDEFKGWFKEFQNMNGITFRVLRGFNSEGKYVIFKSAYRCHHNTLPRAHTKNPSAKHTNCPSSFTVTIKAVAGKRCRSKDKYMPLYPTVVRMKYQHNHSIFSAEAFKYRDPSEEVKHKFLELFQAGHSPSHALDLHKKDLMIEHDDYFIATSDRHICPDLQWVYRLYYKTFKAGFGEYSTGTLMENLMTTVKNLQSEGLKIVFNRIGNNFAISICTPFMERVHRLKSSADIAFLDSSGNGDTYKYRIFLLMVDSCVGGLPIGAFITNSETEKVINCALKGYISLLSDSAFGGRGRLGPQFLLTDDYAAERNALKLCFPDTELLLCTFHSLLATWQWLCNIEHDVSESERRELFSSVSELLLCNTLEEFECLFPDVQDLAKIRNPQFALHLKNVCERRNSWTLCYQSSGGNITEAASRVFIDKIVHQNRSFSVTQLLQFIVDDLSTYYESKIILIISGRPEQSNQLKYKSSIAEVNNLIVNKITISMFEVSSGSHSDIRNVVDLNLGLCDCVIGTNGTPCKHQHAVAIKYGVMCHDKLPTDSISKTELYFVATGEHFDDWSLSLDKCNSEQECSSMLIEGNSEAEHDQHMEACDLTHTVEIVMSDTCDMSDKVKARIKLQSVMDKILMKYDSNPSAFYNAINTFHKSGMSITKESQLLDSLNLFGKNIAACLKP